MDQREEMKRWISVILQNASQEDAALVKKDIDMFLGVSSQLAGILSSRVETLHRQVRTAPRAPQPQQLEPPSPDQTKSKPKQSSSSTMTITEPKTPNPAVSKPVQRDLPKRITSAPKPQNDAGPSLKSREPVDPTRGHESAKPLNTR